MQIQIRAAMAQDYEAAVKILSQVQDMHVEWRPDIYRHTSHLMAMEEFQQAAEDHTFLSLIHINIPLQNIPPPASAAAAEKLLLRR